MPEPQHHLLPIIQGVHIWKFMNCGYTPCVPVTSTNTAKLVKWLLRQVMVPFFSSKTVSIPSLDHPPLPILYITELN